jgi:hypothetical protein
VLSPVIPSKSSAVAAAVGRGCQQLTPALLGVG